MVKKIFRSVSLDLKGRCVEVKFVRNHLSRRIILRLDQDLDNAEDGLVITLPNHTSVEQGLELCRNKADWVLERLDSLTPRIILTDGAVVPLGGVDHTITHVAEKYGLVIVKEKKIFVHGKLEHLGRRVKDWFAKEAKSRIQIKVYKKSSTLGCSPGRISIRDTKSRWGSCSYKGNLSFSWRLVMAPEAVLDYVVAHEVSHLVEHNHGPQFWKLVQTISEDMIESRKWLKLHGEGLHRIG
jgi:predicted metal-dependent hydrolase